MGILEMKNNSLFDILKQTLVDPSPCSSGGSRLSGKDNRGVVTAIIVIIIDIVIVNIIEIIIISLLFFIIYLS